MDEHVKITNVSLPLPQGKVRMAIAAKMSTAISDPKTAAMEWDVVHEPIRFTIQLSSVTIQNSQFNNLCKLRLLNM